MINDYIRSWLTIANGDLRVAEHEMKVPESDRVTEAICFHCQQAVEKFLKAYLVTRNVELQRTHNLEFLLGQCRNVDPDFGSLDIGDLTFYAVELRYPDEFYAPADEEAEESLIIARRVKQFTMTKLGLSDSDLLSPTTSEPVVERPLDYFDQ